MLSYQHGYHAGGIADVVKHLVLVRLLNYLNQKDKPYVYVETHAGKGRYDLRHQQAVKTGEAQLGIEALWQQLAGLPAIFSPYTDIIRKENPTGKLRYYPGSPLFALHLLRHHDRLTAYELHPGEYQELTQLQHLDHFLVQTIQFKHSDGLAALKATLPPAERRGLIFIDPSYEVKAEYRNVPDWVKQAYLRFSTGVYALWYPIVDKRWRDRLISQLTKLNAPSTLRLEFYWDTVQRRGMMGCGLWIINPPYVLEAELRQALTGLTQLINPGTSSFMIDTVGACI